MNTPQAWHILTLVTDYILKQGKQLEDPLYLDHPRKGGRQKGDGHDRYDQDDEKLSLTHASFFISRFPLPANM
jgi:hypothetical protein